MRISKKRAQIAQGTRTLGLGFIQKNPITRFFDAALVGAVSLRPHNAIKFEILCTTKEQRRSLGGDGRK
jgi:hypothetical protein